MEEYTPTFQRARNFEFEPGVKSPSLRTLEGSISQARPVKSAGGNHSGPRKSIQAPSRIPWVHWFAVEEAELPELSDPLFRVLTVLNFIFARNHYAAFQVSDRRLAVICNVHPRTIKRRIARLVEFRLLEADRSQGRIAKYQILPVAEFKDFQKWRQKFKVEKPKNGRKKTSSLEEKEPRTQLCHRTYDTALSQVT